MDPLPLQDPFAERAVLGALLADPRRISDVATVLKKDDFGVPANALLFDAIVGMEAARRQVDTISIADELKLRGQLATVGGLAFLAELDTAAPTAANVMEYAAIVSEHSLKRRIAALGTELTRDVRSGLGTAQELISRYENRLMDLAAAAPKSKLRPMVDVMSETYDTLDRIQKARAKGGVTGLPTGLVDLDKKLTGLHGGQLIVIGARPSVGKTAFGFQLLIHAALHEKKPAAIFSLETQGDQLGLRAVASQADVQLSRLRGEVTLSDNDIARTNTAMAVLSETAIWVDDAPMLDVTRIRSDVRRLKRRHPDLALVVVDYLQLMEGEGDSREQEVGNISRGLKLLAMETNLPVVALAQIGRKADERKGPPQMSDLRESGTIEASADVILLLWPEQRDDDEPPGPELGVEVIIAKQKMGPTCSVPITLRREYTKFVSRAPGGADEPPPPSPRSGYTSSPEERE